MADIVLHFAAALRVSPSASHLSSSQSAPGPFGGGQCVAAVLVDLPRGCLFGHEKTAPRLGASRFPVMPSNDEEYEVKAIVAQRVRRKKP
jgi:hypothetical protein